MLIQFYNRETWKLEYYNGIDDYQRQLTRIIKSICLTLLSSNVTAFQIKNFTGTQNVWSLERMSHGQNMIRKNTTYKTSNLAPVVRKGG